MSETLKTGDKIRVALEGEVVCGGDDWTYCIHLGERRDVYVVVDDVPTVEILERATGPAWDPVGTVRAELDGSAVYVKTLDGRWSTVARRSGEEPSSFAGNELGMSKILGAVPGSPAAEATSVDPARHGGVESILADSPEPDKSRVYMINPNSQAPCRQYWYEAGEGWAFGDDGKRASSVPLTWDDIRADHRHTFPWHVSRTQRPSVGAS